MNLKTFPTIHNGTKSLPNPWLIQSLKRIQYINVQENEHNFTHQTTRPTNLSSTTGPNKNTNRRKQIIQQNPYDRPKTRPTIPSTSNTKNFILDLAVSSNGTFINWPCITLCRENDNSFYHTWKGLSPIAQFFAISPK